MKRREYFKNNFINDKRMQISRQASALVEFAKQLDESIFDYSIDKVGHLALFSYSAIKNNGMQSIFANYFALDDNEKLSLITIGKIYFEEKDKYLEITKLGVEKDYSNFYIGKMLMQAVENIAYDKKKEKIYLRSMVNKTRLKDTLPKKENFANPEDYYKAVKKDYNNPNLKLYFDKNLYFYTCLGYKKTKTMPDVDKEHANQKYIPMLKTRFNKIKLCDGFHLKKVFKPTNRKFAIKKQHIQNNASSFYPMFKLQEEDKLKSPICLHPNQSATTDINHLLIKNLLDLRSKQTKPEEFKRLENQEIYD